MLLPVCFPPAASVRRSAFSSDGVTASASASAVALRSLVCRCCCCSSCLTSSRLAGVEKGAAAIRPATVHRLRLVSACCLLSYRRYFLRLLSSALLWTLKPSGDYEVGEVAIRFGDSNLVMVRERWVKDANIDPTC